MGQLRHFVTRLHQATKRDYLARMVDEKVHYAPLSKSAPNGFVAEPRASRLCERDDTVLAPQIVIQHLLMDAGDLPTVPLRFRRANRRSAWIRAPKSPSESRR